MSSPRVDPPPAGGTATDTPAARTTNLSKVYGTGETQVVALDAVDVAIDRGRFTAIMGPSGSGKSTLMHCLAGLDRASSGQVYIGETDLTTLNDDKLTTLRRDAVGFIFQAFNLVPTLSAAENITLPLDIAGKKVDQAWFDTVVATVGLGNRMRHKPTELSGGQQQRVAIARALCASPRLLLCDEPTAALDPATRDDLLSLFARLHQEGHTIVLITHDLSVARRAERRFRVDGGRVIEEA